METEATQAKRPIRKTIAVRLPNERLVLASLRELVRLYTKHHDDLIVDHALMSANFPISVQVNNDDQGKMVGGGGTNIWALQLIFKVIGLRMGKRLQLRLLPPIKGEQEPLTPFEKNTHFDAAPAAEMLAKILAMMVSAPLKLNVSDVAEETHFEIAPSAKDLDLFRGDVTHAFRNLFTAIGKSQGRRMAFHLADPAEVVQGAPPIREDLPIRDEDLPPGPSDAVEDEARDRGFVE